MMFFIYLFFLGCAYYHSVSLLVAVLRTKVPGGGVFGSSSSYLSGFKQNTAKCIKTSLLSDHKGASPQHDISHFPAFCGL